MHLTLTRSTRYPDTPEASFGDLAVDGKPFCVFVENAATLMPLGTYTLVPHDSPKHPNALAFVNHELGVYHQPSDVPHEATFHVRTDCLIHPANFGSELEGCCAPGEAIARFPDQKMGVTNSRHTMNTLLEVLQTRTGHTAEIRE